MSVPASQVFFYAADDHDYQIALAAAEIAGVSTDHVSGNFSEIWRHIANGNYFVIVVGRPASNAVYYNPCGWSNPDNRAAGSTPFRIAVSPRPDLPGANYFINAAGQQASDTLYLAAMNAYYTVQGSYSSVFPYNDIPNTLSPSRDCEGHSVVNCPCSNSGGNPDSGGDQPPVKKGRNKPQPNNGGGKGGTGKGLFYGTDGSTGSTSCGMDFYIGELGGGVKAGESQQCGIHIPGVFHDGAAQKADRVYGYWFLFGPQYANSCSGASSTSEAHSWGEKQAEAAIQAHQNHSNINTKTIFGDVEGARSYWSSNTSLNRSVIAGFISKLKARGFRAGIYSSPCAWEAIPGPSFALPNDVIGWTFQDSYAHKPSCPESLNAVTEVSCSDSIHHVYEGRAQGFGGIQPTIWQYTQDGGDFDAASSLPE